MKLKNGKTNLYLIELPKGFSRIGYNPTQYPSETQGAAWVPLSYLKTGNNVWANTDGIIDTVSSFTLKAIKLNSLLYVSLPNELKEDEEIINFILDNPIKR